MKYPKKKKDASRHHDFWCHIMYTHVNNIINNLKLNLLPKHFYFFENLISSIIQMLYLIHDYMYQGKNVPSNLSFF